MNYSVFSVEDFVWDTGFRHWVLFPDADSDIFWSEWTDDNPLKKPDVLMAKQIVKAISIKNVPLSELEIQIAISDILKEISVNGHDLPLENNKRNYFSIQSFPFLSVAALIVLVIGVSVLFNLQTANKSPVVYKELIKAANEKLVERVNPGSGLMEIKLDDGSKITLEKNAKISFPTSFNGLPKRKVYLTGEAVFEVAKNPEKPFFVYANGLITKVLGTKFRIKSNAEEKSSSVEVVSGVVAVYSLTDKNSQEDLNGQKLNNLILTRNQKADYSNEERTLMASVVENPVATNDKIFDYRFADTPVKKIFENINEGYGIDIIYDEKLLDRRTITADLSQTGMFEKLNVICKTINARYDTVDGKIIISPN